MVKKKIMVCIEPKINDTARKIIEPYGGKFSNLVEKLLIKFIKENGRRQKNIKV